MEQLEVKYAPGMRIIVRGEEWMVKKVETNSLGNQTLHVIGLSQLVKDYESMFLVDVEDDIEIVDPAKVTLVPDDSAFFRKSKVYIESQWRGKIPTDNKIHIGDKAAMDLMPYQLEPAQMALNNTRQRILIADTVGLGKTLEAGILMSELIARGKGKRILVVTVKSMMTQFQKEMWNRFTIPLVRLDSSRIQSVRAKIPTNYNPFFYYDKTIISVDTLKNDLEYRTHLENAWWDIIVIDECNHASTELRAETVSFKENIAEFRSTNEQITMAAEQTLLDCDGNEQLAMELNQETRTALANAEHIREQSNQMVGIAGDTYEKLGEYITYMTDTAASMEKMRETATDTESSIDRLQNAMDEVSEFAQTIESITAQTNLLALNASIEAARAGEHGKGFAVVAEEVRVLAEDSKTASESIKGIIGNIGELLEKVQDANKRNVTSIEEGLSQIDGARQEAEQIGKMQTDSRKMAMQVLEACEETENFAHKLGDTSERMQELVASLREQTGHVVEQGKSQKTVSDKAENAFLRVEDVADRLVHIAGDG